MDGRLWFKKFAPYKAIHVGTEMEEVPTGLLQQFDYNSRMFIPLEKSGGEQWFIL